MEQRPRDTRSDALSLTGSGSGRAIVIGPYRRPASTRDAGRASSAIRAPVARLEEAVGLARAIDLDVVNSGIVLLNDIRPATYIGKGKVDEIAGLVKSLEVGIVVADCALSPVQQRNLESVLESSWDATCTDP